MWPQESAFITWPKNVNPWRIHLLTRQMHLATALANDKGMVYLSNEIAENLFSHSWRQSIVTMEHVHSDRVQKFPDVPCEVPLVQMFNASETSSMSIPPVTLIIFAQRRVNLSSCFPDIWHCASFHGGLNKFLTGIACWWFLFNDCPCKPRGSLVLLLSCDQFCLLFVPFKEESHCLLKMNL